MIPTVVADEVTGAVRHFLETGFGPSNPALARVIGDLGVSERRSTSSAQPSALAPTWRRPSEYGKMVEERRGCPIALSSTMLAHVEAVLTPEVRSIGTIEGELEGLIIHGTKRFLLYDRLTGRQVICYFGDSVSWERLRDVFGKRMAVTGEIRSRRSGERASIDVSSYYVFPREDELPSADEVRGLLRNVE